MCKIMEDAYNEEFAIGFIEGRIEAFGKTVCFIMKKDNLTALEAMNELGIPDDIRSAVLDYIQGSEA